MSPPIHTLTSSQGAVFLINSCQEYFRCAPSCEGEALFRSYGCFFAEFLGDLSLVRLGLLDLTTCVGLRYGFFFTNLRSFSRKRALYTSLWRTAARSIPDAYIKVRKTDFPVFRTRYVYGNPITRCMYYASSLHRIKKKLWNINHMAIGCDFRHYLRTRLTLG